MNPIRTVSRKDHSAGPGVFGKAMVFLLFLVIAACPDLNAQNGIKKPQAPIEKRLGDIEKDLLRLDRQINVYNLDALPDYLTLCEKKIPIFADENKERFERELFQLLEDKGLLTVVVKRYFKYLPTINEELRKLSLPPDLIFLAVTESYLNPRSVSKANAAGMWQFIKETGKREGFVINDNVDERFNVKKSTRLALTHLKKLYGEFNDWLIAMAAYNAGAGRLREAIENQNTRDFLELYLPEETERYVFRVMVMKEIITNRERYGIRIDEKELYKPVSLAEITMETDREIHSNILAKAMELSYRSFRIYNLHIRRYHIPKGTYRINVPTEKKDAFIRAMKNYEGITIY